MIVSAVFASVAVFHILLLRHYMSAIRIASFRRLFLCALLLGLIYDNSVLALGNVLVSTDIFSAVSWPRFILHVIILPFLTLFSLSTLQIVNPVLGRNKGLIGFAFVFTALALVYGVLHNALGLELGPIESYGHWRITNLAGSPPFATIAANVVAIIFGILVWKSKGPVWLFWGAFLVFILNSAAGPQPWSFISSNLTEVLFVFCLVQNEKALAVYPLAGELD